MTKATLIKFIQHEDVAYQLVDGLLSFSSIDLDPLVDILKETTSLSSVHREKLLNSCFSDLAQWAIEGDYLFISDNGALICLSESLMDRYKSVA